MKGYKVFKPDWTCRGFQYSVGKTFEEDMTPSCCNRGFHFCTELKDCFSYYCFDPLNKVAEIEALGEIDTEATGRKHCTNKIKIVREIQITFHDKTTVAKMKEYGKVVRVGTSKCCSDDTYSAYIGALLALARIYFPNASCDNKEIRFFNTKINPKEKSEYRCDKQFSHSDINKAIYNLISRYDIADTWVAESLNNFGTALHEELENMKEGK